jgi:hypothetical protein
MNRTGYLGGSIQRWIEKHTHENKEWFGLVEDISGLGEQHLSILTTRHDDKRSIIACLLFLRGLSLIQGAILLSERGLTIEARILVRALFETAFYLGAVKNDPEFLDALIKNDASQRHKLAREVLKLSERVELDQGAQERLSGFIQRISESDMASLAIYEAAKKAELVDVYNIYYRSLSNDAAHPSITSLNHYVDSTATGRMDALRWGPDVSNIADTLHQLFVGGFFLLTFLKDILDIKDASAPLMHLWQRYEALAASPLRA